MASLSKIAEGIVIGTGALALFMNGIPNNSCDGGLFSYTSARNFRRMNTINNYDWGSRGRYGYNSYGSSEIEDTTGGVVPLGIGLGLGRSFTYSSAAGDGYSTNDMSTNSAMRFISTDEFTYFESLLRNISLARNYTEDYNEEKYNNRARFNSEDYYYRATGKKNIHKVTLPKILAGDQYSTWETTGTGEKHVTVLGVGEDMLRALSDYRLDTTLFLGSKAPTIYTGSAYGELFTMPDDEKKTTKENVSKILLPDREGVYLFYVPEREEYLTQFTKRSKAGFLKYNWQAPYAIGAINADAAMQYNIDEDNTFSGRTIRPDATVGSFITKNKFSNLSFNYYEEIDKQANTSPEILKTTTIDNSDVSNRFSTSTSELIKKTNDLFRKGQTDSLINRFHTIAKTEFKDSELITSFDQTYGISRGRNLLKKYKKEDLSTGYSNPYCRVWTAHHQYSKLRDRIRPFYDGDNAQSVGDTQKNFGGMRPNSGNLHLQNHSVLQTNGYVRISPNSSDSYTSTQSGKENKRKYMFSIENLAWRDSGRNLSPEQTGPYGGRIMWFPPYNLKFTENITTNWNGNQFIGRGEQIYTYVNTERAGTLSFTLLIDHPSILNKWNRAIKNDETRKAEREQEILRFFAGCDDLVEVVNGKESGQSKPNEKKDDEEKIEPQPTNVATKKVAYVMFFPNNFSCDDCKTVEEGINMLKLYETPGTTTHFKTEDSKIENKVYDNDNISLYNLNSNPSAEHQARIKQMLMPSSNNDDIELKFFTGDNSVENLKNEFDGETIFGVSAPNCQIKEIEVAGFASSHGKVVNNEGLHTRRNAMMKKVLKYYGGNSLAPLFRDGKNRTIAMADDDKGIQRDINFIDAKIARSAYAIFTIEWSLDNGVTGDNGAPNGTYLTESGVSLNNVVVKNGIRTVTDAIGNTYSTTVSVETLPTDFKYNNEYLFFEQIGDGRADLVYRSIVDKVKYFDPAFHSITPEGFNARLTFLQQCTRQGPTSSVSSLPSASEQLRELRRKSASGEIKSWDVVKELRKITSGAKDDYLKYAGNLAFGRAPYCVLRIGDFFNTKICIDSISINYDNSGGVQWDLNPEGAGVQPMFADVNINFKFLGGQDIGGTVEALQNAVSSNYYANASIYDESATRVNE